jgi:hypothetical protein
METLGKRQHEVYEELHAAFQVENQSDLVAPAYNLISFLLKAMFNKPVI